MHACVCVCADVSVSVRVSVCMCARARICLCHQFWAFYVVYKELVFCKTEYFSDIKNGITVENVFNNNSMIILIIPRHTIQLHIMVCSRCRRERQKSMVIIRRYALLEIKQAVHVMRLITKHNIT